MYSCEKWYEKIMLDYTCSLLEKLIIVIMLLHLLMVFIIKSNNNNYVSLSYYNNYTTFTLLDSISLL